MTETQKNENGKTLISMKLTLEEKKIIKEKADAMGLNFSAYIRHVLCYNPKTKKND